METPYDTQKVPHADRSRRALAFFEVDARETPPNGIWTSIRPDRAGCTLRSKRPLSLDGGVKIIHQPPGRTGGEVMNMAPDPSTCETASTFQPLSSAAAALLVQRQASFVVGEETLLWDNYVAAAERARETRDRDDDQLALAAWNDFLLAFIPDEHKRSAIPTPRFLRGRL